jgi:serine/threonine protein kinase
VTTTRQETAFAVTHMPEIVDPRIGAVVKDRYRIVRKLGEGGIGVVYEAEHLLLQRRVALKCLHPQFASNPVVVKRFQNEAVAATSIGHPNIVEVSDMGRFEDGALFMVLEYLDGTEFEDLIQREGPLSIAQTVHVVAQVCDALAAAHAKGIVHRDLKPENIYLVERGTERLFAKVLDFGIAKFLEEGDHKLTQTGQALGTPYYMSPEQVAGAKDVDARTDIYALGVILYHALTAAMPFWAETFPMLVVKICSEPAQPIQELRPDIPPELSGLIAAMLAKDPNARPGSALEVKAVLERYRHLDAPAHLVPRAQPAHAPAHSGIRPSEPHLAVGPMQSSIQGAQTYSSSMMASQPAVVVPQPSSRAPLFIALAALVIALAGAGGFAGWQVLRDPPPVTQAIQQPAPQPAPAPEPAPVQTVNVKITTVPPGAELVLDGEIVQSPFDADLPVSPRPRIVSARLEGYRFAEQRLDGSTPQDVTITLEPLAAPAPVVEAPVAPRRQPVVRPRSAPTPIYNSGGGGGGGGYGGTQLKRVRF